MKRKYGFTLVELLIVLAVIAALIATITPLALNAIRRARASQVAQNLSSLASALENTAYVNGVSLSAGNILGPDGETAVAIANMARDFNVDLYGIQYVIHLVDVLDGDNVVSRAGDIDVLIFTIADANAEELQKILPNAEDAGEADNYPAQLTPEARRITLGLPHRAKPTADTDPPEITFYYEFTFNVY